MPEPQCQSQPGWHWTTGAQGQMGKINLLLPGQEETVLPISRTLCEIASYTRQEMDFSAVISLLPQILHLRNWLCPRPCWLQRGYPHLIHENAAWGLSQQCRSENEYHILTVSLYAPHLTDNDSSLTEIYYCSEELSSRGIAIGLSGYKRVSPSRRTGGYLKWEREGGRFGER